MDTPTGKLYFAYGANMSPKVLMRRNVNPLTQEPAQSTQHTLAFRHRAGFATLVHNQQQHNTQLDIPMPYGVLYTLTQSDLHALRRAEQGYQLALVPCVSLIDSSRQYTAYGFVSHPWEMLPESVPPRPAYLDTLIEGSTHAKLPAEYIARLRAIPTASVDGYGLPDMYYDTPQRRLALFVVVFAVMLLTGAGFVFQDNLGLLLLMHNCF